MEGWDGTADGEPSDLTTRRWERFGISGAKLIWGGEAVAVQHDGRANPNQLVLTPQTHGAIAGLARHAGARRIATASDRMPTPTSRSACSSRTRADTRVPRRRRFPTRRSPTRTRSSIAASPPESGC